MDIEHRSHHERNTERVENIFMKSKTTLARLSPFGIKEMWRRLDQIGLEDLFPCAILPCTIHQSPSIKPSRWQRIIFLRNGTLFIKLSHSDGWINDYYYQRAMNHRRHGCNASFFIISTISAWKQCAPPTIYSSRLSWQHQQYLLWAVQ